jgi:hypothetical protein
VVNWRIYNESLVRRGAIILDFGVIDNWSSELNMMNNGKEGASYRYPNSFVQLLGYMRVYFHLPYRQAENEPTNAARSERYFHIKEPDGYQLSFAKSIDDREENL